MKLLDDLVSTLDFDATLRDIRQGVFHTGVWTRSCGLAATLPRDALRQNAPSVREAGSLCSKTPAELVQMAYAESILEAAIGMAAINSLLDVDEKKCHEQNAREWIFAKGKGKRIAIVGHFPFIPALQEIARKLWVIEKNPQPGDYDETQTQRFLSQADLVAITGSAFTNHTIEPLLECCGPRADIIVLGDTAPLSPVLFDYGIQAVAGTRVVDPQTALRGVSEGATFRQIKGTRRLTLIR